MGQGADVPLRLLVVDDDVTYADMAAEWLGLEGLTVECVESAAEALTELEDSFDCVVSDYDMPKMDGLEFLAAVRRRGVDVPFVMHTGHGNEALASEAIAAGVTDYVPKGFSQAHFATLAARIRLAVERVRTERRFRAVFTQGFDAMLVANEDGYYVDANPMAERIMGLPREELLGKRISAFAEEDFDFGAVWAAFLEEGEMAGEFTLVRPDGERRILEFDAVTNIIPGEHLSVVRDVTLRRQAEATVKDQHDRLDAIAALAREDLGTHVKAIRSVLDDFDPGTDPDLEVLIEEFEAFDEQLAILAELAIDSEAFDERSTDGGTGAAG
jgi:PAS domain S-box-containing protein